MEKKADLIQEYNNQTREFEYFVKGFDVTESVKCLLKAHKDAYDKEKHILLEVKCQIDAEKRFKDVIKKLKKELNEKNLKRLLDEQEFQRYCAYKHIEPEIKGCLDRERNYIKEIALLKKEVELAVSQIVKLSDRIGDCETSCPAYETCKGLTDGDCRNVVIESLEIKAKEILDNERK